MPDRVISVPQATQIATRIKNKFDNVNGRLVPLEEDLSLAVDTVSSWDSVPMTLESGYYRNDTGAFVSDTARRTCKMSAVEGEKYSITTHIGTTVISGIVYFDSNDAVIGHILDGTGEGQVIENYEFTVPKGVASMAVQTSSYKTLSLLKYNEVKEFVGYTKEEIGAAIKDLTDADTEISADIKDLEDADTEISARLDAVNDATIIKLRTATANDYNVGIGVLTRNKPYLFKIKVTSGGTFTVKVGTSNSTMIDEILTNRTFIANEYISVVYTPSVDNIKIMKFYSYTADAVVDVYEFGSLSDATSTLKYLDDHVRNLVFTNSDIVTGESWNDSTTNPTVVTNAAYSRSRDIYVYSPNAKLAMDATGTVYYLFYDENKEKLLRSSIFANAPVGTKYFCFYIGGGGTINSASYKYFLTPSDSQANIAGATLNGENIVIGNVVVIPPATSSSAGYMSASDKTKLDNIVNPGTITINGSGVTKNASSYGFLPTNEGDTNGVALQNAVDDLSGGTVIVDYPGTYKLSRTIKVPSNTTLIFGNGVYIEKVADSNGIYGRYVLLNVGALSAERNENITIKGLKVIPNGDTLSGTADINFNSAIRGLIAMIRVDNLVIDGFEVIDHTYSEYSIQVSLFHNARLENLHIETNKDGVHFGQGDGFVLRHCYFLTNDDAIALNCVDYPISNVGTGDIKNGIIEDIHFMSADGTTFARKRGVLLLTGAWKEWESGNEYQVYGDYCVYDGRLYQSFSSDGPSTDTLVSTVPPTHTNVGGSVTYSDGMRWRLKQIEDVGLSGNVKNVVFRDIFVERKVADMFIFSSLSGGYLRAIYPNATVKKNENITFENVQFVAGESNNATTFITALNPISNIKIKGCELKNINGFILIKNNSSVPMETESNYAFVDNVYGFASAFFEAQIASNLPDVNISICGSMKESGYNYFNTNITPTALANDLT